MTPNPIRICPHCRKNIDDPEEIDPRRRWLYLKSLLQQYYDENSPIGQAVFTILAATSKLQSMYQSERIKTGLEMAKQNGKRLGRPRVLADVSQIADLRTRGYSWRQIAAELSISARTARRVGTQYNGGIHA